MSLKYKLSTRKFSINTRESPVRYATARRRFSAVRWTKIAARDPPRSTINAINARINAKSGRSFFPCRLNSDPSCNVIPHEKSRITKSTEMVQWTAQMAPVKYNFFFSLYNIPAFFPRFRYFRKSLRSGAFPICCGRAADEISIKFRMIERVKKLLPLES